jgi:hypothetical protein
VPSRFGRSAKPAPVLVRSAERLSSRRYQPSREITPSASGTGFSWSSSPRAQPPRLPDVRGAGFGSGLAGAWVRAGGLGGSGGWPGPGPNAGLAFARLRPTFSATAGLPLVKQLAPRRQRSVSRLVRITRTPLETDVVYGVRARRLVTVIVGRSSKRRSVAHSSRISVGLSTWKRAGPSRRLPVRAAAGAVASSEAASANATTRAIGGS